MFSGFFQAIVNVLTAWFRIDPTKKLLNGWSQIEQHFRQTFACHLKLSNLTKELTRIKIIGLWCPLVFFGITGVLQFFETQPTVSRSVFVLFARSLSFMVMIMLTLSAQIFYFILCHVMSRLYKEFYKEIHSQLSGDCSTNKKPKRLDTKTITKWKTMFMVLSKQMKHIGDFLSPADTVHICVRVISMSISVYTVLQSLGGSKYDVSAYMELTNVYPITVSQVIGMAWVSLITNLGIGALQVYFAERIYKAVRTK